MATILGQEQNSIASNSCFVIIKYGDDQEALLNPRCSSLIFVESIKQKCQCDSNSVLDLVDLQGQIRNLPISSEDYASDYVTGRETYVAIRVEKQGDGNPNKYIPLLNNLDKVYPDLLIKLNNMSRPGTRQTKRDRSKKTQARQTRSNSTRPDSKPRPTSAERSSKSRQGK